MSNRNRIPLIISTCLGLSGLGALAPSPASAATSQFRGVNWADPRDNFQSGVIYLSGLSSSDTNSSATAVATSVMDQFIAKLGANSVRLPINEATVSKYWSTYTGVIDTIAAKGMAVLCYWHPGHGAKIPDMNGFWTMWQTVVDKYGANSNVYFEVQNEPNMYTLTELRDLYNTWLTKYAAVPKGRVILDGSGMAQNVPDIGNDARFNDCLLAVHDYSMWGGFESWTTEAQWMNHLKGEVGNFADRTVCTEWGGPMSPGSKNGVSYGLQDYSKAPANYFQAYLRGMSSQLKAWNMGSFYWAGLKDTDWYSMTTKSGSGASITLSIPNQSGLVQLQNSWTSVPGTGGTGGTKGTGGSVSTGGTIGTGGVDAGIRTGGTAASSTGGSGGTSTVDSGTPDGRFDGGITPGDNLAGGAVATGGSPNNGGANATGEVAAGTGGLALTGGVVSGRGGAFSTGGASTSNGGAQATGGLASSTGGNQPGSGGQVNVTASNGGAGCSCQLGNPAGSSPRIGLVLGLGLLVWWRRRTKIAYRPTTPGAWCWARLASRSTAANPTRRTRR